MPQLPPSRWGNNVKSDYVRTITQHSLANLRRWQSLCLCPACVQYLIPLYTLTHSHHVWYDPNHMLSQFRVREEGPKRRNEPSNIAKIQHLLIITYTAFHSFLFFAHSRTAPTVRTPTLPSHPTNPTAVYPPLALYLIPSTSVQSWGAHPFSRCF